MKSKTKITLQTKRKKNPALVETINSAKKNEKWKEIAEILTYPRRKKRYLNLGQLNKLVESGEKIVVPGKILSQGILDKKIKLSAFSFSEEAKEKLKEAKIEFNYIEEEIKKNPSAEGIKLLR